MRSFARSKMREIAQCWRLAAAIVFVAMGVGAPVDAAPATGAAGAPVLLDTMDGEAPALQLLNGGPSVRLLSQSIEQGSGHFGAASEMLRLTVPSGVSAQLAYAIPAAPVIQELRLSAWVMCNHPGAQMAATVVLPRSIDRQSGKPIELLVRGGETVASGWQQIELTDLPAHLADQARVARASRGGEIDERGAYVSQLVIFAPGGPGTTEIVVDQVSVHGVLSSGAAPAESDASPPRVVQTAAQSPAEANTAPPKRPAVPRIIQWQGEPLQTLQRIGFDAVWMGRLPTEHELAELDRLEMFAVCPPPSPEQLRVEGLGPRYARILAWDLGQLAATSDVDLTHRWTQAIEMHETDPARPVLLEPFGLALEASRIADVVMLGRPMLGSTQTWTEYASWLSMQARLARLGTPTWVSVESHCSTRFMGQLAALRQTGGRVIVPATYHALSRATTAAFGVAPRGFYFQSQASLGGTSAENRLRATALELTNLRLGLAEPWLAPGKTATAARSTRTDLTGLVLKVERSHLIVPLRWSDPAADHFNPDADQPIAFDLPGVPESSDAYLVSISGSQRLRARRVTGGLRVSIEHLPDDAFVLVTEDGYAFSHVEKYLRQHAPRAARARVELAALRRQQANEALAALPPAAVESSGVREDLRQVDVQMTAVVETMRRRDFAAAFACAAEAERLLEVALHRLANVVAGSLPPGTSPAPMDWSTLEDIAGVGQTVGQASTPYFQVPGGEFEELKALLSGGWQRVEQSLPGVEATVRLSPESPARGGYCLELDARATTPGAPPMLPRPPVWVTSPAIQVPAGHLVEITGMARVAETPLGSPDPLLIFDSIGGEESAIRLNSAPSWTPFRLLRAAAPGSELRITIALGGLGRAQIDSLVYRFIPVQQDGVAQAHSNSLEDGRRRDWSLKRPVGSGR